MMLAIVLMTCAALGQTASDLGEGLRAELTGTPGVTAIKWWGKAGRTYFVQSSETLLPDSWQYMPVVEAGNEAVCTWNLQTSASKMFVRLVYTDQAFSGGAADADFDGDGLSNLLETAAVGPRSNPLAADTDGDGFSDSVEWGAGFNPVSGTSNPDASLVNGGIALEFAVVDTWDHVRWYKQVEPGQPVKYRTVADYGPSGDYDASSWQETVPTVPSPRGLGSPESLNFGSWSTEPTTGEDLFFDQPLYAYRVEADMAVVPGPDAPFKGGRNSGARYAQLRLVTNYPRMQPVTRLVKVLPEKWNAQYGEGFWQGTYAGPEAPQYYALQLPAGSSVGPPVTAQLEVQTGVARTATISNVLTGVFFERDEDAQDGNWQPLTGTLAKALPGQLINLKINGGNLPPGVLIDQFEWVLPGTVFKDYTASQSSATLTPVEASDKVYSSCSFYFADAGTKNIQVNFQVDGNPASLSAVIDIAKPPRILSATTTNVVLNNGSVEVALPATSFYGGAESLMSTFKAEGRTQIVQLVKDGLHYTNGSGDEFVGNLHEEWALDEEYPFAPSAATGNATVVDDSPASDLETDAVSQGTNDEFKTYLMFKPPGAASRWVPLELIPWGWRFEAVKNQGGWSLIPGSFDVSVPQSSTSVSTHPVWQKRFRSGTFYWKPK
jgi:hypothetical protein